MSTEPSPLAAPAGSGAPGVRSDTTVAVAPGPRPLDGSAWCRWWRELILERYRIDRFDACVPLPATGCTWEQRVALGRVVDQAMADVQGPAMTTQLVIDALDAAGFGRVRDLVPDARRTALVRAGWWGDRWPAGDGLRLGVLGSVADALLREVPPSRAEAATEAACGSDPDERVRATVLGATRAAVLAYACHVEGLATRSRVAARSLQF